MSPKTLSEESLSGHSLLSFQVFYSHVLCIPKSSLVLHASPPNTPSPLCKCGTALCPHEKKSKSWWLICKRTVISHTQRIPCISEGPWEAEFIQPPNKLHGGTSKLVCQLLLYQSQGWSSWVATGKGLHRDWILKGHELERNSTL